LKPPQLANFPFLAAYFRTPRASARSDSGEE
jgi:hypothetical protein